MIVLRLNQKDLLALVSDERIVVDGANGDVDVLRVVPCNDEKSSFEVSGASTTSSNRTTSTRRPSNGRRKSNKTGKVWRYALYESFCRVDRDNSARHEIAKGDVILYDFDNRVPYCETHGAKLFPDVPKPDLEAKT